MPTYVGMTHRGMSAPAVIPAQFRLRGKESTIARSLAAREAYPRFPKLLVTGEILV